MRRLLTGAVVCVVAWIAIRVGGGLFLAHVVGGEGFRGMLSREVSKAIKVEGEFRPMRLGADWTVETGGFESTGWPGEAIGVLDAEGVRARFAPSGVLRRLWEVDLLTIESGRFVLREPDDALKRHPVSAAPPWSAAVMPRRFFCRWIECARADVEFPFGGGRGVLGGVRIGALMVERNFKYYLRGGRLDFPMLPVMEVDAAEVYVTREEVDIGYAWMREAGGPGWLFLEGSVGQGRGRGLDAAARFDGMPLGPMLPGGWRGRIGGRIGGNLTYGGGVDGGDVVSGGSLRLVGGELRDWGDAGKWARYLDPRVLGEIGFGDFDFRYRLRDGVFRVEGLRCEAPGLFRLDGGLVYRRSDGVVGFDMKLGGIVLDDWLAEGLRGRVAGTLGGEVRWSGSERDLLDGAGGGVLRLEGGRVRGFRFQDFLCRFLKDGRYGDLGLGEAHFDWEVDGGGLVARNIEAVAVGLAGLRGEVRVGRDGALGGEVLVGLPDESLRWLPGAAESVFGLEADGMHWATVRLSGTVHEPRNDFTAQVLGQLRRHPLAMAALVARGLGWWLGDVLRGGEGN